MGHADKAVRQTVTLPAKLAAQVRTLAKIRRLTFNRMLVELIERGIESEQRNHKKDFVELAKSFRKATDSTEAERLGDKLGEMVFGT